VKETVKLKINNTPIRSKKCRSLHRHCFISKWKKNISQEKNVQR